MRNVWFYNLQKAYYNEFLQYRKKRGVDLNIITMSSDKSLSTNPPKGDDYILLGYTQDKDKLMLFGYGQVESRTRNVKKKRRIKK